ncbi:hypothetical protein JCM14076_21200 [Methylosoma difficile]
MICNAEVFILCEDTVHYHFTRKYLQSLGFTRIRGDYKPKGRSTGSGAEFVKKQFEKELQTYLRKKNHLNYILVVVIDDDTKAHAKKLHQHYSRLPSDTILIFSPKRNIESWFHYIEGNIVDETEDYKRLYQPSEPSKFAKKLKQNICSVSLPNDAPSSLHHACTELNRLKN